MTDPRSRLDGDAIAVLTFLILGAGFVAMFLNVSWFWMIWVLGFAVVLPIVSVLSGADDEAADRETDAERTDRRAPDTDSTRRGAEEDPLATLRDRYARGEIDEETFERKLEALLETETPENARDRVERRSRERSAEVDAERE